MYNMNPYYQQGYYPQQPQQYGYQPYGYSYPQQYGYQQQPGWTVKKLPYNCTGVSCVCDNGSIISKQCGPSGGTCDTANCSITCIDNCFAPYSSKRRR